MSNCSGRGECIQQCCCICFDDEEYEIPSKICSCGHREHEKHIGGSTEFDIYCKGECDFNCKLIGCHNFKLCSKKGPQQYLDCHNSMCSDCAINIGKIKFLDKKDECPVCLENKDMIQVSCEKHNFCLDCWKQLSKTPNRPIPLSCPLCRENIWKWKGR